MSVVVTRLKGFIVCENLYAIILLTYHIILLVPYITILYYTLYVYYTHYYYYDIVFVL